MNTLAFLLLTTCTPGADPVPIIDSRTAMPAYGNYGGMTDINGQPQESRPRFFARLRNLFGRKSQGMDNRIETSSSYPYQMTGNSNFGNNTVIMPSQISTPSSSTGSIIRSQPTTFTPSTGSGNGLQRMPTGQPAQNGQPF